MFAVGFGVALMIFGPLTQASDPAERLSMAALLIFSAIMGLISGSIIAYLEQGS